MPRGMSAFHVFLTRPDGRNGSVPQRLRALGMEVSEIPALEVRPIAVSGALPLPETYDVVVFVSRYAVRRYLELLAEAGLQAARWPARTIAATVGASSAQALLASGRVPAANIVHPPAGEPGQDSEALLAILLERNLPLNRVLIVRGASGREWLAETLRARGTRVDLLPVYDRVPADWPPAAVARLSAALSRPARCLFLLTSSEGVRAVAERVTAMGLMEQWRKAGFVVIHERIGATLQSVVASQSDGDVRRLEHCMPDDDSIVAAIQAVARLTAEP